MGTHWKDGYSSHVDLSLVVNGEKLRVAQVGPESLILQTPRDLEPGFADLIIRVDDSIEQYRIALYEGSSARNPIVRYDSARACV
ncbi:MAG TPA: hypothetical protein VMJ32_02790 [Pirellulales bacterium]|nr:hypothetical protein [Pirellulales bacterium]